MELERRGLGLIRVGVLESWGREELELDLEFKSGLELGLERVEVGVGIRVGRAWV